MEKIAVLTDSGSSISPHEARQMGIWTLPLQIIIENKVYDDISQISTEAVYHKLDLGIMPKTSMPTYLKMMDTLKEIKHQGYNCVIAIPLTSGISNTADTLQVVARDVGINLYVIDTYTTCQIQKHITLQVKKLVDQQYSSQQIIDTINDNIDRSDSMIIANNLTHLKRGGRLTPLAASLANMLKIYPILTLNKQTLGKIDVLTKVRTYRKAQKIAVEHTLNKIKGNSYKIYILHSNNEQGANEIYQQFLDAGIKNEQLEIEFLNSVIAVHTGLDCLAIQYIELLKGGKINDFN